MRKMTFTLVLLLVSAVTAAAPTQPQLALALHDVKAEELVFDASWEDTVAPVLTVRMFDNGASRNGYAGYLCMIISEHEITGGVVRVVDVVSKLERVLGETRCK